MRTKRYSVSNDLAQEIAHIVRTERVVRLTDVVLRRTLIALENQPDEDTLCELAEIVGAELGWSEDLREAEIRFASDLLSRRYGVSVTRTAAPVTG